MILDSVDKAVAFTLRESGSAIRIAMPLGIGKPNTYINALYGIARENPALQLDIYTALSLLKPQASSELEQRFLQPLTERLFGNYPDLDYALDMQRQALPANVAVHEFFLKSGDWLANTHAQQHFISSNYTHIARDMASRKPNVLAQAIAVREVDGKLRLSLSCNPDVTLDLAAMLRAQRQQGEKNLLIGVINRELPFMPGAAEVPTDFFDVIVDDPAATHTLFCTPNMKVSLTDYAIGLHASSLVQDGGTLQIGIGSLGDAISRALIVRHYDNADYCSILHAMHDGKLPDSVRVENFREGLYACTEMFVNGLLELVNAGVVKRGVTDSATGCEIILHGGFFIGPPRFYQALRDMPEELLAKIDMNSITYINHLYADARGTESGKRRQRVKAAFINTCMMVTLSGAAISDGLEDGRVVSGVGGQYNFVAMAHELPEARSILMLRSWRMSEGKPQSNIVTHYASCTIPRHLRDIVITEYGIADLRGKSDADVIAELLKVSDSRFQDALRLWAVEHKKLPADYVIPARYCQNTPERLNSLLQPFRQLLPDFPFGHDFTDDELVIIAALQKLKAASSNPLELLAGVVRSIFSGEDVPERYRGRMGFDEQDSLREKLLRKVFAGNF
ncbi:MAG TPA: acetyl-CoA hydrolase/transferase C-terminal domain-containing protein [Pseudomonadales bacterium]|nr:acetyl-CoA hydrolase/transferase C-terminal domain-containing protein [Pseudomonadales bacterium]